MPAKIDNRPRQPRNCLRCNKTFPSTGPGHRICDLCSATNGRMGRPVDARAHGAYHRQGKSIDGMN